MHASPHDERRALACGGSPCCVARAQVQASARFNGFVGVRDAVPVLADLFALELVVDAVVLGGLGILGRLSCLGGSLTVAALGATDGVLGLAKATPVRITLAAPTDASPAANILLRFSSIAARSFHGT